MDVSLLTQNGCASTAQEDKSSCCDKKKENQDKICLIISDTDAQWCHLVEISILNNVCQQYVCALDMGWPFHAFSTGMMDSIPHIQSVFTVLTCTVQCKGLRFTQRWQKYCTVEILCNVFLLYGAMLCSKVYFCINSNMQQ